MYYAARLTDDAHHGRNASRIHYDADDGMYLEAMRDLKFVIGNAGMQMLRGPMFSNMLKTGRGSRGKFFLAELTESELRERLLFGPAIPSVRTLNRCAPEASIDCGGMSPPLRTCVAALRSAYHARVVALTRRELEAPGADGAVKLARPPAFDGAAVRALLHGQHDVQFALPHRPQGGYAADTPIPWFHAEPVVAPVVGVPVVEGVVVEGVVAAVGIPVVVAVHTP